MKNTIYYGLLFLAWILYTILTLISPYNPSAEQYGFTPFIILLVQITILVPYLFTWGIGLYGILHLSTYVQSIQESGDGKALSKITSGLSILLISLIVVTFIGLLKRYFYLDQSIIESTTIVTNYLYVFTILFAFVFIASGSLGLLRNIHQKKIKNEKFIIPFIPLTVFSVIYVALTFTNENRQIGTSVSNASYYLPDVLILFTIVLPTIIGWVYGLISIVRLLEYKHVVSGILYKKALNNFIVGILFVIISSAILHVLLSFGSARLLGLGLTILFVVIYLFVAVQALGYFYIARGAKKLTSIEKV